MLDLLSSLLIALAGLLLLVIIWLLGAVFSSLKGGPPIPTKRKIVEDMIRLAGIRPRENVADLGAGDGRLIFAAARAGAKAVGYEVSYPVYIASRLTQFFGRYGGVLKRQNIFDVSLKNTDIVFCYLLPETMKKLRPKFERELAPGTRVISHAFPVPGWPVAKQEGRVFLQVRP